MKGLRKYFPVLLLLTRVKVSSCSSSFYGKSLDVLMAEMMRKDARCFTFMDMASSHLEEFPAINVEEPVMGYDLHEALRSCPFFVLDTRHMSCLNCTLNVLFGVKLRDLHVAIFMDDDQYLGEKEAIFQNWVNVVILVKEMHAPRFRVHIRDYTGEIVTVLLEDGSFGQGQSFEIFPSKLRDIKRQPLTASTIKFAPFIDISESKEGEKNYGGIEIELVETLAYAINADLHLKQPIKGTWGRDKDGNGVYDGIVGELQSGRADLGFAQLFIKQERTSIMDFSLSYNLDYNCFLVLRPPPINQSVALIKPYSPLTWLIIAIMLIVATILSLALFAIKPGQNKSKEMSIMYIMSIVLVQSHSITHHVSVTSTRIFLGTFILVMFILSKGYSGSLISFLTVPIRPHTLNTIRGVSQSKLATGSHRGSSYISTYSTDPDIVSMRSKHLAYRDWDGAFQNYSVGELIMYQSKQFLDYNIRTRLTNENGETDAHIVQECPQYFYVAIGLRRFSKFKSIFDDKILSIREAGLIDKWYNDAMEKAGKLTTLKNTRREWSSLSLKEMEGAFYSFAVFISLSVVAFVIEQLCFRIRDILQISMSQIYGKHLYEEGD